MNTIILILNKVRLLIMVRYPKKLLCILGLIEIQQYVYVRIRLEQLLEQAIILIQ